MKTLKISVLALTLGLMSFSTISSSVSNVIKTVETAAISWKSESIDIGEIPQGKPRVIEFEFKNSGKTGVIIKDAHASCGCTGTNYPKETIEAGKSAKITATFNAASKGPFTKTVTVTTNADVNPKVLTFKGTVI